MYSYKVKNTVCLFTSKGECSTTVIVEEEVSSFKPLLGCEVLLEAVRASNKTLADLNLATLNEDEKTIEIDSSFTDYFHFQEYVDNHKVSEITEHFPFEYPVFIMVYEKDEKISGNSCHHAGFLPFEGIFNSELVLNKYAKWNQEHFSYGRTINISLFCEIGEKKERLENFLNGEFKQGRISEKDLFEKWKKNSK